MIIIKNNTVVDNQAHTIVDIDNVEYYEIFRKDMEDTLARIFESDDREDKYSQAEKLWHMAHHLMDRIDGHKAYSDNPYDLVVRKVIKPIINEHNIKRAVDFGKEHEYPQIVLQRDHGKIVSSIGPGEKEWANAITWAKMPDPYRGNFINLLNAIEKKDYK